MRIRTVVRDGVAKVGAAQRPIPNGVWGNPRGNQNKNKQLEPLYSVRPNSSRYVYLKQHDDIAKGQEKAAAYNPIREDNMKNHPLHTLSSPPQPYYYYIGTSSWKTTKSYCKFGRQQGETTASPLPNPWEGGGCQRSPLLPLSMDDLMTTTTKNSQICDKGEGGGCEAPTQSRGKTVDHVTCTY